MNDIEFKSTFDKIEFDIAMKMYFEHNSKIASINDHIGEMYSYKDLEEAKALEEYNTLQEYKKALKEKCDVIDKAIEYIKEKSKFDDDRYLADLDDILKCEDIKEIPQFEGTLDQLDKLSIRGEQDGD